MKVSKKLEFFYRMAMDEAEERKKQLNETMLSELENACYETNRQAYKNAENKVRSETFKIEQLKNREIIKASTESKRALIELRNKLQDEVFEGVERKLAAFTKSADYAGYLAKAIQGALAELNASSGASDGVRIILRPADFKLSAEIKNRLPGLSFETESGDDDFLGGFIMFFTGKRGFIDYTFKTRLAEERQNASLFKITAHHNG